ncbi:MAG: TonB family protein [Deltaproteobacteria bacterium]|nr:TonB family protein [Deltaproteobacteria bacterium]
MAHDGTSPNESETKDTPSSVGVGSLHDDEHLERGDGSTVAKHLAVAAAFSTQTYILFAASFGLALIVHLFFLEASERLPERKKSVRVKMAVVEVKPPPPPEPKKEEPKPEPKKEKPKPKPKKKPKKQPPPPKEPPPPSNTAPPPDAKPPTEPVPVVTGISTNSLTKSKSNKGGMKVRVGNTTYGDPNKEKFVAAKKVQAYVGGKVGGKAVRAADISVQARLVKRFHPKYPRQLVDEGIEGQVVLIVTVDKKGRVIRSKIVRGVHPVLDKLSQKAAKLHRYKAAQKNGEAVVSNVRLSIRWEILD